MKNLDVVKAKYISIIYQYDLNNLIGRKDYMKNIKSRLNKNKLLIINGTGGLGKSTIAKAYIAKHEKDYENILYMEISSSIISEFINNCKERVEIDYSQDINKQFNKIINYLYSLPKLLIVIDNLDNDKDFKKSINSIMSTRADIIITSRKEFNLESKNLLKILPLQESELLELIKKVSNRIFNESETSTLKEIIKLTDGHTKLIKIIAKILSKDSNINVNYILEIVKNKNYNNQVINSFEVEDDYKNIYPILMNLFNTANISNEELELMKYIALFPSIEIEDDELFKLIKKGENINENNYRANLKSLINSGWVDRNNDSISIHSLIQYVLRESHPVKPEDCEHIIDNFITAFKLKYGESQIDKSIYTTYSKDMIELWKNSNYTKLSTLLGEIAFALRAIGDYDMSITLNERAIDIRKKNRDFISKEYIKLHHNMAVAYGDKNELGKKEQNILIVLDIYKKIEDKLNEKYKNTNNDYQIEFQELMINKSRAFNNLALTYQSLSKRVDDKYYKKMLEYNCWAFKIRCKFAKQYPLDLARTYNNLSTVKKYEKKALRYAINGLKIRKNILNFYHQDLALSYYNVSIVYKNKGMLYHSYVYGFISLKIRARILRSIHKDYIFSKELVKSFKLQNNFYLFVSETFNVSNELRI